MVVLVAWWVGCGGGVVGDVLAEFPVAIVRVVCVNECVLWWNREPQEEQMLNGNDCV